MPTKLNQIYQTKNDIVYNALKEQIVTGEIMPGERITVMQVAEEFGVSAMPVREALKRLQQEGLVTITPHAGAEVVKCDDKQYQEITQIRVLLEPYAAMLATQRLSEKDMENLEKLLEKMGDCVENGDNLTYSELNTQFHQYIYNRCGNATLIETINSLWEKTRMSKNVFLMERDRIALSMEEHRECMECLRRRDPEAVRAAFDRHKRRGFEVMDRGLRRLK